MRDPAATAADFSWPAHRVWLLATAWWLLNAAVWTVQVATMQAGRGVPAEWAALAGMQLVSALLWIPLTVGLLACVRRWPLQRGRMMPALWCLWLAVLAVIVLRAVAVVVLDPVVGWYAQPPAWSTVLRDSVLNNLLSAWMIIGVAHGLVYAQRERERERHAAGLEARLAQVRLERLGAQLHPHFLFNALNSIAELVHVDPRAADRTLVGLGELLRYSLDRDGDPQVPLAEELERLSQYVDIERARLGPRLQYDCDVANEVLRARVPCLILQPLVENAVRHAIAPRTAPGRIHVQALRDGRWLRLEVRDDGEPGLATAGAGTGLRITRARLQALYGDDHRFELVRDPAGGSVARLELPYTEAVA